MLTKKADIITAAILMLFGVIVAVDCLRAGIGWAAEGPQGGFFPFVMAVLVIGGTGMVIRDALRGKGSVKGNKVFVEPGGMKPILIVIIPACLMILFIDVVGLYLSAMIYLVGYIRWAGDHSWRTSLLVGILVPLASYIVFDKFFLIPMPMGLFGAQILRF